MVHALCRPNRILLTKRKFTFHHFKGGGGGEREREEKEEEEEDKGPLFAISAIFSHTFVF